MDPYLYNEWPVVDAGSDRTIYQPTNSITLSGSAYDDGLPNGSSLTTQWSLVSGPGSVTFGSATSPVTTATFPATGVYTLQLTATDGELSVTNTATVTLNVDPRIAPTVSLLTPTNGTSVEGGLPVTISPRAIDVDGWISQLEVRDGNDIIILRTNTTAYSVALTSLAVGSHTLTAIATDNHGLSATSAPVSVTIASPIRIPPVVTVVTPPNGSAFEVEAGETVDIDFGASATDDGFITRIDLLTNNVLVKADSFSPYSVTLTNVPVGVYALTAIAFDNHGLSSTSAPVQTTVFVDQGAPTAQIALPIDAAIITQPTNVIGTVSSPILYNYQLQYREQLVAGVSAGPWVTFANGTSPVANGVLGQFDPTLLLNGIYEVRLVATDLKGRSTITESITLTVDRQMKVGHFSFAFSDLTIPLSGMPIEVIRSYDTRYKRVGDFGYGWTLGLKNIRLQKNRVIGNNWEQTTSGGIFQSYVLTPRRDRIVTITFPDGEVFKFKATTSPSSQFAQPIGGAAVRYEPLANTRGTLVSLAVDQDEVVIGGMLGPVDLLEYNGNLYNPTRFKFTSAEGDIYIINEATGLESMTDRHGNSVTLTTGGITHSTGRTIQFLRDSQSRITNIVDTAGNALKYEYNGSGDLVRFIDRENQTNSFTYDSQHKLLTMTDPRGVQAVRNEYDNNGRLVRQIDSLGRTNEFIHDLAARHEIIRDRLGNVTVHEYDENGNITRTTDALQNVTSHKYDANDNLLFTTNALGDVTSYTYDSKDNKLTETDPLGNVTRYTYDSFKQMTSVKDARGFITTNIYSSSTGDLLSQRDPLGNVTQHTYNGRGDLLTQTDALGNVTSNRYDNLGNLTNTVVIDARFGVLNETSFTYDSRGNQTSKSTQRTLPNNSVETLTTTYGYDNENRLKLTTFPDGSTNATIYNALDKPVITIDQLGRQTVMEYDATGNLTNTVYPDLTSEIITYDAENRQIGIRDRGGRITVYTNDVLGRVVTTVYPGGGATNTFYDAIGRIVATQDERGNPTWFEYDPNCGCSGRKAQITNALGQVTRFSYDANGNETSMVDANNRTYTYTYDALDRRTHLTFPDNTQQITTCDALGRRIAERDQAGKITQYDYDALGRLIAVTNAINGVTRYAYNEVGNLISQTDANNNITRFEYDKLGRRTKRTLPLSQVETYAYDAAGNMTNKVDFNGKTTVYAYDSMSRLLSRTPDSSFNASPITFTYTATGERAAMVDPSGTTTYLYNERDWLTNKATPQGTLSYTHDARGNLTGIKSSNANGTDITYEYDALNRLQFADAADVGVTEYAYDAVGNLAANLYPNGVTNVWKYDALNRLTNLVSTHATLGTRASYVYSLGAAGNRTAVAELSGRSVGYGYDDLYRLTSETIQSVGQISYTHDAVGNRLTRSSTVSGIAAASYSYDDNDRLTTDSHDANGNTTSSGGNADTYDFEDRLTSRNTSQVVIIYDGDGNKVRETAGGVTTHYLVDDKNLTGYAQVLEELSTVNSQLSAIRVYSYGLDLISQDQLISGDRETSFYGYDGHGNTRYLSDITGAVTDTYDYDAFGTVVASSGPTPNTYLYCGEQLDPGLGLYYLRARYLNVNSGRFWTSDKFEGPLAAPWSLHKFGYAYGDPVNLNDPSGLDVTIQSQQQAQSIQLTVTRDIVRRSTGEKVRRTIKKTIICQVGVQAIKAGLDVEFHHPVNQGFGGPDANLLALPVSTHKAFHSVLNMLLRSNETFGGLGNWSSSKDWLPFTQSKAGRQLILTEIRGAARIIDRKCKLRAPNSLLAHVNKNGPPWVKAAPKP